MNLTGGAGALPEPRELETRCTVPFPFEIGFDEVRSDLDACVDAVFGCLESEFLVMPKGDGFVEFPDFESGYEALKRATGGFREVTSDTVAPVVFETPIALIVLRCMLGFTPSEWAYHTSRHTGACRPFRRSPPQRSLVEASPPVSIYAFTPRARRAVPASVNTYACSGWLGWSGRVMRSTPFANSGSM